MSELIYPVRQRCRRCRNYFDFIVIKGLYCSWECAGMPPPSANPDDWPRGHYHPHGGARQEKRCYLSDVEAQEFIHRSGLTSYASDYLCDYCGMWHVGTLRRPETVGV